MASPSFKQVSYAQSLGVVGAENMDSVQLSKAIADKKGVPYVPYNKPFTSQQNANSEPINAPTTALSQVILTRTDKPHSYEFGKASARHKIYYNSVEELTFKIEELKQAGLIEDEFSGFPPETTA